MMRFIMLSDDMLSFVMLNNMLRLVMLGNDNRQYFCMLSNDDVLSFLLLLMTC
jgi:hypothetical protein